MKVAIMKESEEKFESRFKDEQASRPVKECMPIADDALYFIKESLNEKLEENQLNSVDIARREIEKDGVKGEIMFEYSHFHRTVQMLKRKRKRRKEKRARVKLTRT